ncbi:MAG: SCF ubiquitin ligase complex subunit cdc4 [Cirrosporium novae-zelandiae]|nr:MAG: SCF ubiquitin ligase complex subunit cdc4 [Cirrosporium novae-zelandiae]
MEANTPRHVAKPMFTSADKRRRSSTSHVLNSSTRPSAAMVASSFENMPRSYSLGQFSFAPTTQTTVVTTTTTTTTNFPPLVMKAPRHLERDPKLYPLAAAPTPPSVKRICFDLEGVPGYFTEAEDTEKELHNLKRRAENLRSANGRLESVTLFPPHFETSKLQQRRSTRQSQRTRASAVNPEPTSPSPVSISKAVELANQQRGKNGSRRVSKRVARNQIDIDSGNDVSLNHMLSMSTTGPATPDTDSGGVLGSENRNPRGRTRRSQGYRRSRLQETPTTSFLEPDQALESPSPRDKSHRVSSISTQGSKKKFTEIGLDSENLDEGQGPTPGNSFQNITDPTTTTSLAELEASEDGGELVENSLGLTRPRLAQLDTAAIQDLSLPSPSLSPVTAAANLQRLNANYSGADATSQTLLRHGALTPINRENDLSLSFSEASSTVGADCASGTSSYTAPGLCSDGPQLGPTLMDIPKMLDMFEAIPDELKSLVMYQMLRRCPRPALQIVADIVNPAIKRDFFAHLPLELTLNIVKSLDVKSMCRAAQVSKKWRQIVDSDEKAWQQLFEKEGFDLPEGELQRAIQEGWGWQYSYGPEGAEQDLNPSTAPKTESDYSSPSSATLLLGSDIFSSSLAKNRSPAPSRRSKRKATTKFGSRKQPKRKAASQRDKDIEPNWMSQMQNVEGPYAAATAAAAAVPYANVGLPSLRGLHLYKSLYRRHYLIRKSWMQDEIKPQHLAFRAHDRHVVTCLQFDNDKIITGSDDNEIHVYDTRTGALRTKLKGHEGGVWALQYVGNTLVSGSTDRSVRVWDIKNERCTQIFQGHTSTVRCLQIIMPVKVGETVDGRPIMTPNEPLIVTGSRDSNIRIWKLPREDENTFYQTSQQQSKDDDENPFFIRVLAGHAHSVRAVAAYADTLVSGSYDTTVRVWKISTGETIHRLQGHTQKVYSVVLDHKRNRCISGSMDNLVKVWSLDTGSILYNLEGHSSLVGLLDLNNDRLVSAAADSTLRIWDPETGQCKSTLTAHTGAITCFQHDAIKVVSGSDRTLKMWNVRSGECVKDLLTDLSGVWQVKFDERRCVAAVQRNNMTYIEVLDFGASRDGTPEYNRGRRITVNTVGREISDTVESIVDLDDDEGDDQV